MPNMNFKLFSVPAKNAKDVTNVRNHNMDLAVTITVIVYVHQRNLATNVIKKISVITKQELSVAIIITRSLNAK